MNRDITVVAEQRDCDARRRRRHASTFSGAIHVVAAATISKVGAGTVRVNALKDGAVAVFAGTLQVMPGQATPSRLNSVAVTGGQLDLTDGKMILTGQTLGVVEGLIGSGGLTSSSALPQVTTQVTTLAAATAGSVSKTTFGGNSVAAGDVLVMYTYAGDADLSGDGAGGERAGRGRRGSRASGGGNAWIDGSNGAAPATKIERFRAANQARAWYPPPDR